MQGILVELYTGWGRVAWVAGYSTVVILITKKRKTSVGIRHEYHLENRLGYPACAVLVLTLGG